MLTNELVVTVIQTLKDGKIPTIFILTGIGLVFLAIVGKISGKIGRIELTRRKQIISAILGGMFIVLGVVIEIMPVIVPPPPSDVAIEPSPIFVEDLASGYDIGLDTSDGLTDWMKVKDGEICMTYPDGQSWGAVFITVGKPKDPPRPGKDFTKYRKLSLELRGQVGGEAVSIGIKDAAAVDGSETKIVESNLTADWASYEYPLSSFESTDLQNLYTVTEFIFGDQPENVCARNIRYLP